MDPAPDERANLIRGHKATLSNPRVSDEAKEHSRRVLEELGEDPDVRAKVGGGSHGSNVHDDNVARGLKAATHNPRVSEEAKQSAEERLREMEG